MRVVVGKVEDGQILTYRQHSAVAFRSSQPIGLAATSGPPVDRAMHLFYAEASARPVLRGGFTSTGYEVEDSAAVTKITRKIEEWLPVRTMTAPGRREGRIIVSFEDRA